MPTLTIISKYPVKSLRGHDVNSAMVERMGLESDRRLMLVNPQGKFLTQRNFARMALITPILNNNLLNLSAPGMHELSLEVQKQGKQIKVEIWNSHDVAAIDQGDLAADWFSDFLKMPARLVHMAEGYHRRINSDHAIQPDDHVSFADGYPILIVSQASLDDLNNRLDKPIRMNRFRVNLVVDGVGAFEEDQWKRIRLGSVELALVKQCARCNVPTINQESAETGKEPNTTLASYRKFNGKVMFGVNVIPVTTGLLQVGQTLEVVA